jgi:hypothetical protein
VEVEKVEGRWIRRRRRPEEGRRQGGAPPTATTNAQRAPSPSYDFSLLNAVLGGKRCAICELSWWRVEGSNSGIHSVVHASYLADLCGQASTDAAGPRQAGRRRALTRSFWAGWWVVDLAPHALWRGRGGGGGRRVEIELVAVVMLLLRKTECSSL